MKRIRKVAVSLFLLFCLGLGTLHAAAADELLGTVVDGSVLTDKTEVGDTVYARERGAYFSSGSGHLIIAGTGSVQVSGSTNAYQNVDEIKVTLRLQRLVNGSWTTVATLGPTTKYNTYYVSSSKTYSVARGYYYRVKGSHSVKEGSKTESASSATDAVWVP